MAAFGAGRLRVDGLGDLGHAAFCAAGAAALTRVSSLRISIDYSGGSGTGSMDCAVHSSIVLESSSGVVASDSSLTGAAAVPRSSSMR